MAKIHRFIGNWQLGTGTLRIDDPSLARQLRKVLNLQAGELVVLGDGRGLETQCRILTYDRDAVILEGLTVGPTQAELPGQTTLYCAVLKADHFEIAAQKATEVGVSEIIPLVTKRTVKLNLKLERVRTIVREAAELAGRGRVPRVHEPIELDRALTHASRNDVNFFFDPSGQAFKGAAKAVHQAGLWVGPEGGWEEGEIRAARDAGMQIISLGALILRAETAVIVASYLVAHSIKS